jgi:uncharacterized membrane protein
LLSKPTVAPLVFASGALLLWKAWPLGLRPLRLSLIRLKILGCFLAMVLVVELPWLFYRHVTSLGSLPATTEGETWLSLFAPSRFSFEAYLKDLTARGLQYYRWLFIKSFWALFGWLEIALSEWIYTVIQLVCLVALVGLVVRLVRCREQREVLLLLVALVVGHVLFLTIVSDYFLSFKATGQSLGMQGRYFLPILAPLLVLLLSGLSHLFGNRPWLMQLLPLALLALQLASLAELISGYYAVRIG